MKYLNYNTGGLDDTRHSPFIPVARGWRYLIIAWVLVYQIFMPGLGMMIHGPEYPLAGWRFAATALYHLLFLLPVIFYQKDYGWLHPLIFAIALTITQQVVRDPIQLLSPLMIFESSPEPQLFHAALYGLSSYELARVAVETTLLSALGLLMYYVGFFFSPKISVPRLEFTNPKSPGVKSCIVVGITTAIFLVYVQISGGLTAHLDALAHGRFSALAGQGHIVVLIQGGIIACIAWYAFDKRAFRNPVLWICTIIALSVGFITNASRSGVVLSLLALLMIWMLHNRKLPAVRVILFGVFALIIVGVLGEFRESPHTTGNVDAEILTDFNTEEMMQRTIEESKHHSQIQGPIAVIAMVPEKIEPLYGESYLGALLFFIPRAIWEDKPRGVGAMYAQEFFGATADGLGIPIGPVGEAYWNFHIPGVILVFFLFGIFYKWLTRLFFRLSHPAIWVPFVLILLYLEPTGPRLVTSFQQIALAIVILWFFGVRIRKSDSE